MLLDYIEMNFTKTLEKTTKKVVTNKYVLYVVFGITFLNVLAYLGAKNYVGLAIFAIIGLLASYFTQNMTIILVVTIVASSLLHVSRKTVEHMTNKKSNKEEDEEESDGENDGEDEDSDAPVTGKSSKINHQESMRESYSHLNSILGDKKFKKMTKDTNKLLEQQTALTESLQSMTPLLENAQGMLKGLDLEKMGGMLDSLNLDKKKKN